MRAHRVRGALVAAVAAMVVALASGCTVPPVIPYGPDINYIGVSYLDTTTGQWVGHYGYCGQDASVSVNTLDNAEAHAVISDEFGAVWAEGDLPGSIYVWVGSSCFAVNLVGPEAFSFNVTVNFNVHA